MNGSGDLASLLRDIHLPQSPAWWPPRPGWWLVVLVLLAAALWWLRRLPAWKREALERLKSAEADYARHGDAARLLADVSVLLRVCAMKLRDRADVAGLTGQAWIECLRELGRGACPAPAEALVDGAYRKRVELDAAAFVRSAATWIRRARSRNGSLS
ncbi:MAG: DUF4381 domain-containing protein [Gammaproteobacteria bacterium]|nr:DUF4381 domain-containing protein [Gammaproteobacteria bacterium]MYF68112.1 DUF4381 domain-containing protein [Gammaproteobacteria bacterium]MYK37605.1 DUF4381 domain-containing protein [Gammaproteobacteria bacterium]